MASVIFGCRGDVEYCVNSGDVRRFEWDGEVLFDVKDGIVSKGWRDTLILAVELYGLDVDKGMGLNAFVYKLFDPSWKGHVWEGVS